MKFTVGFLAALAFVLATSTLFARTWTDRNGRQVEAEFVRVHNGRVILKDALGQMLPLPLSSLSDKDQAFVLKETGKEKPNEPIKGHVKEPKVHVKPLMRIWTDIDGNKVRAAFIGVDDGMILLRSAGEVKPFEFNSFTVSDRQVMRQHLAALGKSGVLPAEEKPPRPKKDLPAPAQPPKANPPVPNKTVTHKPSPQRPPSNSQPPVRPSHRYQLQCRECGHQFPSNLPVAQCPKCRDHPTYQHRCYRCGYSTKSKSKSFSCPRCKKREQNKPSVAESRPKPSVDSNHSNPSPSEGSNTNQSLRYSDDAGGHSSVQVLGYVFGGIVITALLAALVWAFLS